MVAFLPRLGFRLSLAVGLYPLKGLLAIVSLLSPLPLFLFVVEAIELIVDQVKADLVLYHLRIAISALMLKLASWVETSQVESLVFEMTCLVSFVFCSLVTLPCSCCYSV